MRSLLKISKEKKGSVAVMTAACMFALVGMAALVADAGVLYLNHSQLENMTDAGALAGAQEYLIGTQANVESVATDYALNKNGKLGDIISVQVDTTNNQVIVTANRNVDLFFAKVFDKSFSGVSAISAARIGAVTGVSGAVPFAVTVDTDFTVGQPYHIKLGSEPGSAFDGYHGNFAALALGGTGGNVYKDNIINGYNGTLSVNDWVSTETGNMIGPTEQGVKGRIALDTTNYTAQDYINNPMLDSSRLVIVPIVDSLTVSGRTDVQIMGFAGFFLNEIVKTGGDTYVSGTFIRMVIPAEGVADGEPGSAFYELYGTMLVDPKNN